MTSGRTSAATSATRASTVYTGRVNSAGQQKGVDVSLALDLIQATPEQRYDAAIIVSQDADFGPAVRLAKNIAHSQKRYLLFESAFPVGRGTSRRGLPGTTWTHIDQATYDACRDHRGIPPALRKPRVAVSSSVVPSLPLPRRARSPVGFPLRVTVTSRSPPGWPSPLGAANKCGEHRPVPFLEPLNARRTC